jgi:hypothetical protein
MLTNRTKRQQNIALRGEVGLMRDRRCIWRLSLAEGTSMFVTLFTFFGVILHPIVRSCPRPTLRSFDPERFKDLVPPQRRYVPALDVLVDLLS